MISHGLLNEAKSEIKKICHDLSGFGERDIIMGVEPSEVLVWRDEAKNLINKKIPNVLLIEELLLRLDQMKALPRFEILEKKVWVFEHCHQKSLAETKNLIEALKIILKLEIEVIDTGCCGMAGDFGYKFSQVSNTIAHQSFDKYIKKIHKNDILIATGTSCRKQILDIFSINSIHLPQLFFNAVK